MSALDWVWTLPIVCDMDAAPLVGTWYRVPHIVATTGLAGCWPVLGPIHEDAEIIGQPLAHYHFDPRFLSASDFARICDPSIHPIEGAGTGKQRVFGAVLIPNDHHFPILLPARCQRRMPPYVPAGFLPWLSSLEAAYRDTRTDCRTCPHRGMPLATFPVDRDGAVTCRGHGLRWDVSSGALRPRSGGR
jgi:hypothetical protein